MTGDVRPSSQEVLSYLYLALDPKVAHRKKINGSCNETVSKKITLKIEFSISKLSKVLLREGRVDKKSQTTKLDFLKQDIKKPT